MREVKSDRLRRNKTCRRTELTKVTRWAPTGYKWGYIPYKWPYNWVTGVITLVIGVITQVITGWGPTLYPPENDHLVGGNSNIFGIFTPNLGEDEPNLTNIFQMGWNHQPVTYSIPFGMFESMIFLFPFGGICDRSLEGIGFRVLGSGLMGIFISRDNDNS